MNLKFDKLRKQYPNFYYKKVDVEIDQNILTCIFTFSISNLVTFHPTIQLVVPNIEHLSKDWIEYYAFHIGLVEIMSYVKCTCSPNIVIEAGYLSKEQMKWFQKLYYLGLGEFRYINQIDVSLEELFHISCTATKKELKSPTFYGSGNLIPIGGGKDSIVSLEILKSLKEYNHCFILNPKDVTIQCAKVAGYMDDHVIFAYRKMDPLLLKFNHDGYLNGHTPFSALLAFLTYFVSYLYGKQYILLSNESSANEATVLHTDINHQYSKSYQFEKDFNQYIQQYFQTDIQYFSFLRPLNELQIGRLFSHYLPYHFIFKSCNVGSKKEPWKWCCSCPKCLFVFCILSPFMEMEHLVSMFGENLFEKKELLNIFQQLLGYLDTKPFECVGTVEEVRFAVSFTIQHWRGPLPYLLQYFKDHYPLEVNEEILQYYNLEHNIPCKFEELLKRECSYHVS